MALIDVLSASPKVDLVFQLLELSVSKRSIISTGNYKA